MKSNHFGLHGVCLSALMLGFHYQTLQGQDATPEYIQQFNKEDAFSKTVAIKLYPDSTNKDSQLVTTMWAIDSDLKAKGSKLYSLPSKPLILAALSASILNLQPHWEVLTEAEKNGAFSELLTGLYNTQDLNVSQALQTPTTLSQPRVTGPRTVEQVNQVMAFSKTLAVKLYPDCAVLGSPLVNAIVKMDSDMKAKGSSLYNVPAKPFIYTAESANVLNLQPHWEAVTEAERTEAFLELIIGLFNTQDLMVSVGSQPQPTSQQPATVVATTPPPNGGTGTSKGGSNSDQQVIDQLNADSLADANQAVAQNPNFAPAYEDRGFAKLRLGDLNGAIADFSRAIEISPKNVDFYRDRGDAKLKQGDLKGSISDFEMVVSLDPDAANAYPNRDAVQAPDTGLDKKIEETTKDIALNINNSAYLSYGMRGDAKISKGDLAGAKADIDQAIALNPKYSGAFNSRTTLKEKMGDWAGALTDANQAIALDPSKSYLYVSRGEVELHQGDFDGAIADDTKAVALDPTIVEAYIDRGWAKHQKGDLIGAITDYKEAHEPHKSVTGGVDERIADANQKIALNPNDAWAMGLRGGSKALKGDLTGAIADYTQAITLDPKNTYRDYFYYSRGQVKEKQGDLTGAVADYTRAIALDPKKAEDYYSRGQVKRNQGDLTGAIADFSQAIELDPHKTNYFSKRGEVKFRQNDFDGAISDYTQAIAIDPSAARLYTGRGEVKEKKGDIDGAVADYSQAISIDPQDGYAFAYRGRVKAVQGDWDGAIADCDKALEWDAALAVAYYNRGLAKDKKGDHEGAVADYNQAISFERLQGKLPPTGSHQVQPPLQKGVSMGTGFFVTSTGYILTDNHVVKGASTIRVKVGSSIVSAILAAADASNDIALLKITGTYPCLPLGDSSGTSLGQTVFTVGFPEPQLQGLSPKLTKGEISSLAGMQDNPGMFQISVPVQPGNSGGCLVDESGNVVGLIEATLSTVETAKQSGDLLQNVNYATKINLAKKLISTVAAANSGLTPLVTAQAPFTENVKTVEQATVFIIADSSGVPLPANHLYTDSAGNTFSVSESDYQRLYPQSLALDAETKKLNQLNGQVEAESQRIQQDRQNLDNTDAQAVANFNAEVDNHNAFLAQVKQETEIFNAAVDRFNAELKRVGTLIK